MTFYAEVISIQRDYVFFNIDLGFRIWKILEFEVTKDQLSNLKVGQGVALGVEMQKEGRERTYKARSIFPVDSHGVLQ